MTANVIVAIPVKNGEEYLSEAIESVINQSYPKMEILVVDDGSTDNTCNIISAYMNKFSFIKSITNKESLGIAMSLNKVIIASKAKYFARLDCDDIWTDKYKIQTQVNFLETHSNYSLVGTRAVAGYSPTENIYKYNHPTKDKDIRSRLLFRNLFVSSSILARLESLKRVGGYKQSDFFAEDYGVVLRLGAVGRLANLDSYSVWYRLSKNGISGSKYLEQVKSAKKVVELLGKSYDYYYISRLKWLIHDLIIRVFGLDLIKVKKYLYGK